MNNEGALKRKRRRLIRSPIVAGVFVSLVMLTAFSILSSVVGCENGSCPSIIHQIEGLTLNEVGDTLAGLFSSLAFIWIVVAVFIQRQEMNEQQEDLKEQKNALVEISRNIARAALVVEDERNYKEQNRAEELLDELIRKYLSRCSEILEREEKVAYDLKVHWSYFDRKGYPEKIDATHQWVSLIARPQIAADAETDFRRFAEHVVDCAEILRNSNGTVELTGRPNVIFRDELQLSYVRRLAGLELKLSEAQREKLYGLGIQNMLASYEYIYQDKFWDKGILQ